ncbi:phasin family protein [Acidocella sp.]|uniref:phasin family protein n=1 Tax=Acidocella sp. TaxID=50710 RepID=UPI002633344D|nr:phasin family protein [Acidocella sp.]
MTERPTETTTEKPAAKPGPDALSQARKLPGQIMAAQQHAAERLARANQLVLSTARELWTCQSELFGQEMEHMARSWVPPANGAGLGEAMAAAMARQHERSERMVTQMRRSSDLMRDLSWGLLALQQETLEEMAKQMPPLPGSPRK